MDTRIKQQYNLVELMEKYIKNVAKQPVAKRTTFYYESRISGWAELWLEFRNNHKKITHMKTEADENKEYFAKDIYDEMQTKYYEFASDLKELADKASTKTGVTDAIATNNQKHTVPAFIRLPPADVPKFSGDYATWMSFRDRFLSIIKNAGDVSEVQKLDFLMNHLEGEALQLVDHIPIQEENFAVVWDALTRRFENNKLLVNAQLKILFQQQSITNEKSQNIKKILDTTNQCIQNLKNLKIDTTNWDPMLVFLVVQKLPSETFVLWEQQQNSSSELPSFSSLATFLENRFRVLEAISQSKDLTKEKVCSSTDIPSKVVMQNYHGQNSPSCSMCSRPHYLGRCLEFKKISTKERENVVKKNALCFNCLANTHLIKKCTSNSRCCVCKRKHHTLLHRSIETATNSVSSENTSNLSPHSPEFQINSNFAMKSSQVLLATAKINLCGQDGQIWAIRALIDPGSQGSFLTEDIVQKAGLKKLPTRAIVTGFGKTETGRSQSIVNAVLKSKWSTKVSLKSDFIVLKKLTSLLPSSPISTEYLLKLSELQLADPNYSTPGSIEMLLGADLYPKLILGGVKKFGEGCLVAQQTIFGWVLSGPIPNNTTTSPMVQNFFNQMELDKFLKRFWEMEESFKPIPKSKDDEWCEKFYYKTHQRLEDGRYCVRLPFLNSKDGPIFGNSKRVAIKRLEHVEARLEKNKALKTDYTNCIEEYEKLGHMRKLNPKEAECGSHYFIPHHAVIKESSTSTKVRVVFDASCKTTNRKSLNDQMHIGPRLQPDITLIITRWRCFKYVFCTDVEKMYRQIWVHPEDTKYQRILWRNDLGTVENFELLTVTFGTASAPWLAIRTLHQLGMDEGKNYPQAAHVIKENIYVDDVMTGGFSIEETMHLREDLENMFDCGGFKLKKWASNRQEILRGIPESNRIIEFTPNLEEQETIKTLGIFWAPQSDEFMFKVHNIPITKHISKRQVLSWLARIYDPLGWVAPVLIVAKIIIQNLWQEGLGWDEKISTKSQNQWNRFAQNLEELKKIRIPRWIGTTLPDNEIELHGFSDASEAAFGAVIYSKTLKLDGSVHISLVMAKTKVAPLKTVRLPRLELAAAVLLGKLFTSVQESFKGKITRIYAWTDSLITLSWIKNSPNRWPTFVANRVADLHDLTGPSVWRYVPTEENPADCCSRGLSPNQLVDFPLWWNGPKWLTNTKEHWPSQKLSPVDPEKLQYKKEKIKTFATFGYQ